MIFITGYSSNQNVMHAGNDDSVLNLKRELRDHLATSNGNTADGEEGSTPTATTASTSEQVCIDAIVRNVQLDIISNKNTLFSKRLDTLYML